VMAKRFDSTHQLYLNMLMMTVFVAALYDGITLPHACVGKGQVVAPLEPPASSCRAC
jgi:hypothetical protein